MTRRASSARTEKEARKRFEVLFWAAGRPGVLSLLEALRAANYDETGTEYLRRIVSGTGAKGERAVKASDWCRCEIAAQKTIQRGPSHHTSCWYYSPVRSEAAIGGGPDDFGGEDYACFTGSEEERAAAGRLIDRLSKCRNCGKSMDEGKHVRPGEGYCEVEI